VPDFKPGDRVIVKGCDTRRFGVITSEIDPETEGIWYQSLHDRKCTDIRKCHEKELHGGTYFVNIGRVRRDDA
jgi:hypothetical protein